MQVHRLFVCVDPPASALDHLAAVVDDLHVARANTPEHSTRLSPRDRWHVTLAFLGDLPAERVAAAASALDAAWTGDRSLVLRFAGGGTFGRGKMAILWAGVGGDVAGLRTVATAIRTELRRSRLPFDDRPFRPHLTISRPGERIEPGLLAEDAATLNRYEGPEWTVEGMQLVASELGPRPTYTTLRTTPQLR